MIPENFMRSFRCRSRLYAAMATRVAPTWQAAPKHKGGGAVAVAVAVAVAAAESVAVALKALGVRKRLCA